MITTVLFDIGDTLVRAAAPGTPVDALVAEPLPGALHTLQALARSHRIGAVTDTAVMSEADVRAALAGTGLGELLEVIVTSHDVGAAKPDPRGVQAALHALGAAPSEALFVGDADVDEAAAAAAGVAFARVTKPHDDAPTSTVDSPLQLAVRAALTERSGPLHAALALVGSPDAVAERAAIEHQDQLTKPPGSLGRLEQIGAQLAAIAGEAPPPVPAPAAVAVFAGDHGVVASGVTPWPQEVTGQMVANIVAGGAAINVLARQAGASVTVVDVGVASDLDALGLGPERIGGVVAGRAGGVQGKDAGRRLSPAQSRTRTQSWGASGRRDTAFTYPLGSSGDDAPGLLRRRVRAGTADLSVTAAMTNDEARAALDIGAAVAAELVAAGARALVTGDMGIGNTTASAAVIAALTGSDAGTVTGRGTGIDDEMLRHKVAIIDGALERLRASGAGGDPVAVLAEVGGLEIAALAGFIVGGASHRVPVVVDGVIAGAALLAAHALCPEVLPFVVAGHRSTEPGASRVLGHLGLEPVIDLGLRLGEGSGACLALPVLEASARILREMATFDTAAVKDAR